VEEESKIAVTPSPPPCSPRKRLRSGGSEGREGSPARRQLLSLPLRRQGGCAPARGEEGADPLDLAGKQVSKMGNISMEGEGREGAPPPLLTCPMCPYTDREAASLQEHVNRLHLDSLSPAPNPHACPLCPATFANATLLQGHFAAQHPDTPSPSPASPPSPACPVCGGTGWSPEQLQLHVDSHFASTSGEGGQGARVGGGRAREEEDRARRAREEEEQFASLQAQYGMGEQGNYGSQAAAGLRRAVVAGNLSVIDYYEKSAGLAESSRSGLDDGTSMTPKITSILRGLSASSHGVAETLLAARTDHYAAAWGDKGWGCGFRNLQMLLSCLLHSTLYRDTVAGAALCNRNLGGGGGVPSIPRLQAVVEAAWRAGFDRAGCEQLGGRLVNSRKWIGATEVATLLSYCGVDTEILDFHAPSAPDGSHPRLFDWVVRYFRRAKAVTPPLYLQHQGHSRTIVGAEVVAGGGQRLLVLDPSHSPASLGENTMRLVRKSLASMRSKQYQVVAVVGLLGSAAEREGKKVIVSRRIPE